MNEAFGSISEFKREVSELMPKHKAAMAEIKELVQQVEEQKQQYIEVCLLYLYLQVPGYTCITSSYIYQQFFSRYYTSTLPKNFA